MSLRSTWRKNIRTRHSWMEKENTQQIVSSHKSSVTCFTSWEVDPQQTFRNTCILTSCCTHLPRTAHPSEVRMNAIKKVGKLLICHRGQFCLQFKRVGSFRWVCRPTMNVGHCFMEWMNFSKYFNKIEGFEYWFHFFARCPLLNYKVFYFLLTTSIFY